MRQYSIYDLTYGFLKLFYEVEQLEPYQKRQTMQEISQLLRAGWTDQELVAYFMKAKRLGVTNPSVQSIFNGAKPRVINLLVSEPMFYHNKLRLTSPPPFIHYDYETGESKRQVVPYYLELRTSFTMNDLMTYFKESSAYQQETMSDKRLEGAFSWLLKSYSIEDVLFMIDEAHVAITSGRSHGLSTPSNLSDYYLEAKRSKERKINELRAIEGDKIVVRKRN